MSEHRNLVPRFLRSLIAGRRWLTGGIAAFGVSSLILGGLASPASALDLPNNVELEQWADVAANWTNGSLGIKGAGASTYAEGETVPFHLDVTTAGVGTFDFSICRDYMDGGIFGYLRLAPYDTSFNGVLSLLTGSITDAADGDEQPFTGAAVAGSVHINSVHEVGGQGSCGAGQRETQVQVTIAEDATGGLEDASVLWGGRLASPADPGVGGNHGAGFYPGASLSMRLGGSAKNVGIKPDAIIQLTINQVIDPIIIVDPLRDPNPTPDPSPDPDPVGDQEVQVEVASTTTTATPLADPDTTVAGGGDQVAVPAPVDQVLSGEVERAAPAPAATLPRTGMSIGRQVTLAFGLMGAGIVSLALARRRSPVAHASK